MYQGTIITTAPDGLPLSLAIATQQLRKDLGDCDEELVVLLVTAATDYVQRQYGLYFINQAFVEYYDAPPTFSMTLYNRPITAVTKVEYKDATTGDWTTWDEVTTGEGAHGLEKCGTSPAIGGFTIVYPKPGQCWPTVACEPGALRFTCTAGYGDSPEDVPAATRSAMLLMLSDFYENPENPTQSIAMTAAANLLRPHRRLI